MELLASAVIVTEHFRWYMKYIVFQCECYNEGNENKRLFVFQFIRKSILIIPYNTYTSLLFIYNTLVYT